MMTRPETKKAEEVRKVVVSGDTRRGRNRYDWEGSIRMIWEKLETESQLSGHVHHSM